MVQLRVSVSFSKNKSDYKEGNLIKNWQDKIWDFGTNFSIQDSQLVYTWKYTKYTKF